MLLTAEQQRQLREQVHGAFERALVTLDGYERTPARWEEDCLVRALAEMTCGAYLAATESLRYFNKHTARHINAVLDLSRVVRPQPLTTRQLRDGLANIRGLH